MAQQIMITLLGPDGESYDITARAQASGFGSIQESTEATLSELTHSDLDLELDDHDGMLADLFDGVTPTDVWQVVVERETVRRRPKWERIFAGLIDLPWSLQIHPLEQTISMQVFSYSKLLERASGENVRRILQGSQGPLVTTTGGSATVTFTLWTTYNILAGDKIEVSNGIVSEERTVKSITDSFSLETTETWTNAFTNAPLSLKTPYYRSETVQNLLTYLFAEGGITQREIRITTEPISAYPLPQPINTVGIPTLEPRSLVDEADKIRVTFPSGTRKDADGLLTGFVDGTASTDCQGDTWPYGGGATPMTRAGVADNGVTAWDDVNSDYYYIAWETAPGPSGYNRLKLKDNGSLDTEIIDAGTGTSTPYDYAYLDYQYNGTNRTVWVSWKGPNLAGEGVKVYNVDTAAWTTVRTDASGQLRSITGNGAITGTTRAVAFENRTNGRIEFYDAATVAILADVAAPGGSVLWTLRAIPQEENSALTYAYLGMLYRSGVTLRLKLWNCLALTEAADLQVSSVNSQVPLMTVWRDPATNFYHTILYAGGVYSTLSVKFLGLIPYADFSGMSCAKAIQELAQAAGCFLSVDAYAVGTVAPRVSVVPDQGAEILDENNAALAVERIPVFEDYQASVEVEATDYDGSDVKVIIGDTGDSARRLSISPSLPMSHPFALLVGTCLYNILGRTRREERIEVERTDEFLRPLMHVWYDSRPYIVVEASTDLMEQRQELRLVELV